MALLKVSSIESLYFDRIYALSGVSLEVQEGSIYAVLGPNGAGKTTLLRTIAGLLQNQPNKGIIEFAGARIDRKHPEKISRRGIVYVPEDRGLFRELSVAENLALGCWGMRGPDVKKNLKQVYDLFPILEERSKQQSETLSGGQQQMLALGRAMLRHPKLLMLDEPSLGLAPQIARSVYDALLSISKNGTTILIVEQNAALALGVAQDASILEAGRIVLQGTAQELKENDDVREVYLGLGGEEYAGRDWKIWKKRRRW